MTLEEFFFDTPIYTKIEINNAEIFKTFQAITDNYHKEEFEGFNPWSKIESTFVVITDIQGNSSDRYTKEGGYGTVKIKCKRTDDIFWFFLIYDPESRILTKVGQFPSVADFHISEIKQYKKLLPQEKLKEFTKAIGLAANGVGIGSFVYLRRIFEHLISEAFNQAETDEVLTNGEFQKSRMDTKIDLLSGYLPSFLVENKSMYSILSLGIHELNEQTCLEHFDTLRVGIEIILDEKLDELKKKEKIENAKKKLANLKGEVKK
jgi:hypothetical protein